MSSLTHDVARLVHGLEAADLPAPVAAWACRAITDTVGCALAGAGEPAPLAIRNLLGASAGATRIWGTAERGTLLDAAQINGTAAHALDFDDCNLVLDGHPSVSIVPGLLGLAEQRNASGAEVLAAYVAGIEAEIRIARLSNPAHADRGWHPTVTFGVLGAAIAASRLLRLPPERIAAAIGIAASSAAGLRANSGTMTKPFHAGMANRNGLQAALLAEAGMTANTGALEHKFGFMAAFNGGANNDYEAVLADWGLRFEVLDPGIAIKQYPCCAFIHCAIDAAVLLREAGDFVVDEIAAIRVHLHPRRLRNIDRPCPRDDLDARFSTQYLTARALLNGVVTFADFETPWQADAATMALAAKVELAAHGEPDISFGRVEVTLRDGRVLEASATVAMGRGPDNPMTSAQFFRKFLDCATRVLPHGQAAALLDTLLTLPGQTAIGALMALLAPAHASNLAPQPACVAQTDG